MALTKYNKITYRNRAIAIQVSCSKIRIFEINLACEITKIEFPVLGIVLSSQVAWNHAGYDAGKSGSFIKMNTPASMQPAAFLKNSGIVIDQDPGISSIFFFQRGYGCSFRKCMPVFCYRLFRIRFRRGCRRNRTALRKKRRPGRTRRQRVFHTSGYGMYRVAYPIVLQRLIKAPHLVLSPSVWGIKVLWRQYMHRTFAFSNRANRFVSHFL